MGTVQETKKDTTQRQQVRLRSNLRIRKLKSRVIASLTLASVVVVLYPLLDMLYRFVYKGATVLSWSRLATTTTSGTGLGGGGLANAIAGSLLIIGLSTLFAVPLGVLSGVYLAEFSKKARFAEVLRFISDVLAGVPSIILGYVGFLTLVLYFGWGYSAVAAAVTLSALMYPYILRTTDVALRKVPDNLREAFYALGSSKTDTINRLTLRMALPSIMTGILLAVSISVGETAPLLYTANFSNYLPTALFHSPVAYLTGIIWFFSQEPSDQAVNLAYLATFLLILIVITINIVAKVGLKRLTRI